MEVLREETRKDPLVEPYRGFNPCFNGSVERGASTFESVFDPTAFQSLF